MCLFDFLFWFILRGCQRSLQIPELMAVAQNLGLNAVSIHICVLNLAMFLPLDRSILFPMFDRYLLFPRKP